MKEKNLTYNYTTKGSIMYFSKNIANVFYFSCTTKKPNNVYLYSLSSFEKGVKIPTKYEGDNDLYSSIFKHKGQIMIGVNQLHNSKFTIYNSKGEEIKVIELNNSFIYFHSFYFGSILTFCKGLIEVYSLNTNKLLKSFKNEKTKYFYYIGLVLNKKLYATTLGGIIIFDWIS